MLRVTKVCVTKRKVQVVSDKIACENAVCAKVVCDKIACCKKKGRRRTRRAGAESIHKNPRLT